MSFRPVWSVEGKTPDEVKAQNTEFAKADRPSLACLAQRVVAFWGTVAIEEQGVPADRQVHLVHVFAHLLLMVEFSSTRTVLWAREYESALISSIKAAIEAGYKPNIRALLLYPVPTVVKKADEKVKAFSTGFRGNGNRRGRGRGKGGGLGKTAQAVQARAKAKAAPQGAEPPDGGGKKRKTPGGGAAPPVGKGAKRATAKGGGKGFFCFEHHPAKGYFCPGEADGSCPYTHYDTTKKDQYAKFKAEYEKVPPRFQNRLPPL